MGPEFYTAHIFPVQPGLWVPSPFATGRQDRTTRDLLVYGRLNRGRSLEAAQAAMRVLATRLATEHPETNHAWSATLVPLREHVVGSFTRTATILLAAAGLVFIAGANVASLMLARGTERVSEIAVRTALGSRTAEGASVRITPAESFATQACDRP